jgi:OOP family OmpA-OmpF porin
VPGSSDDPQSEPVPAPRANPRLVRYRPGLGWLLAVVAVPVLLTVLLIAVRTGPIEEDLQTRSLAALDAQGITGVWVDFSGRDATVVVPAGVDPSVAREVVAGVDGVRTARTVGGAADPGDTARPTTSATSSVSEPAPPAVAPFSLARTDKSLSIRAVVPDQGTKDAIVAGAQAVLGEGMTLDEKITVDAAVAAPSPTAVSTLVRALSAASGEAAVTYDGFTVTLTGEVADRATKAAAARSAATAAPGAVVADQLRVPVSERPPTNGACQTFESRLTQLMARDRIGFLSGSSLMDHRSRLTVARVAALLDSCVSARIEAGGYTDNLGSPASSLPLSQRRADAVKAELVRLGVAGDRITARGYGEARPLASNATPAGRITNRRVEIKVV